MGKSKFKDRIPLSSQNLFLTSRACFRRQRSSEQNLIIFAVLYMGHPLIVEFMRYLKSQKPDSIEHMIVT